MLILKVIQCKVPTSKREEFHELQRKWEDLSTIEGFYAQLGGYHANFPSEVTILAFWRDMTSYQTFMATRHDSIFFGNGQQHTCDAIHVSFFDCALDDDAFQRFKGATHVSINTTYNPNREASLMIAKGIEDECSLQLNVDDSCTNRIRVEEDWHVLGRVTQLN